MARRPALLVAASAMAVVTGLSGQICLYVGPVPYTMQNFGVMLSGLLLPPGYALLSQLTYLALIAAGAPLAAGLRGGIPALMGPTAGYLYGFPLASAAASLLARPWLRRRRLLAAWLMCAVSSAPIYGLGAAWLLAWLEVSGPLPGLYALARHLGVSGDAGIVVAVAGVLAFLPQDLLMDHTLAVIAAARVRALLEAWGVK